MQIEYTGFNIHTYSDGSRFKIQLLNVVRVKQRSIQRRGKSCCPEHVSHILAPFPKLLLPGKMDRMTPFYDKITYKYLAFQVEKIK
jgi:hypothetical protein